MHGQQKQVLYRGRGMGMGMGMGSEASGEHGGGRGHPIQPPVHLRAAVRAPAPFGPHSPAGNGR